MRAFKLLLEEVQVENRGLLPIAPVTRAGNPGLPIPACPPQPLSRLQMTANQAHSLLQQQGRLCVDVPSLTAPEFLLPEDASNNKCS